MNKSDFIHGNIKPTNILVDKTGENAMISDFGSIEFR